MASFLRRLRARIKYWNHDRDVAREIEAHREMAAKCSAGDGASRRDARAHAARVLGNTTLAREDARAVWLPRQLQHLGQDLRYGLRGLRRQIAFTITAVLTIGFGLGVLVGLFSVFNAVYLRPWPVSKPSQVFGISVAAKQPKADGERIPGISFVQFDALRGTSAGADLIAKREVLTNLRMTADGDGRSGRVALVSDDFFRVLGLRFLMGGPFDPGGAPSIVMTHAAWEISLGGEPAAVGRTIYVNKLPVTITGVLERDFKGFPPKGPLEGFVAIRHSATVYPRDPDFLTNPTACCVDIAGRLRPGWSRAKAAQELTPKVDAVRAAYGVEPVSLDVWDTAMASRPGGIRREAGQLFALLFGGCLLVTLLACANIGNLQLARGLRRQREIAVRLSLGASRARIVRQLMTESALLAALGCIGALTIAWLVPPVIMSVDTEQTLNFTPDAMVVAFAMAVGVLATIGFGLAPAMRVTRFDWKGATASVLPGASRLRNSLMAVQIALSLGVVGSATLLTRAVVHARSGAEAGFDFERLSVVSGSLPRGAYDGPRAKVLSAQLIESVRDQPGIAWTEAPPWINFVVSDRVSTSAMAQPVTAKTLPASSAIYSVLGVPIVEGRAHDDTTLSEVVINRTLASMLWPGESPIGRTFTLQRGKNTVTVVGLIGDARLTDISTNDPVVIQARDYRFVMPQLVIAAEQEHAARAAMSRLDPRIIVSVRPLSRDLHKMLETSVMGAAIASGLGLLALLLAGFGVFGVFAYVVEERRQEIGLRLALGATSAQLRRAIAAVTARPLVIGLVVGLGLCLTGGFLLRSYLFGLSAVDLVSYVAVALIMTVAALLATFAPLRRALRVDPAVTLRQD